MQELEAELHRAPEQLLELQDDCEWGLRGAVRPLLVAGPPKSNQ